EKQWKYRRNAFTLSSDFLAGSANPAARVRCRYLLAATRAAADMQFEQKASAVGGTIVQTGQTQTDMLDIDWAYITQNSKLKIFFGTTPLPNDRQLDIEVYQIEEPLAPDADLAEQVFKRIAEGLKFKDNQLLEAGSVIVAEIKNIGLDYILPLAGNKQTQSQESFFLIKDARNHSIGFTMDVLIDSGTNDQLNIQAVSFLYARGRYAQEQAAFFQSDNSFNKFAWKSETVSPAGRSGTEITLDEAGVMAVGKLGTQIEKTSYQLGPAAIPDVFLEMVFKQTLDSNHKKIIVDIIDSDGQITPTLISRIEAEEEPAYVLEVEFLDGRGFSEQVYLDNQKQVSKILLQQKSLFILERTSAENILREFPEQANYILQKNKMLEQNQPK
ncbi:unnamed protein product, partial [marine sediment metagenome]